MQQKKAGADARDEGKASHPQQEKANMAENETLTIVDYSEDISEQEAPEPLPVGTYNGVIRGAEVKLSGRGTRYAAITFHISPEQFPADYDADNNPDGVTIVFRRVSLEDNPRARFQVRQFCERIGTNPPGRQLDLNDWVGLSADVAVDHDSYEGVTREQITRVVGS